MKIKNAKLLNPNFWGSFRKLMELEELPVGDKLGLVKTKKELAVAVDSVHESFKFCKDDDDKRRILEVEFDYEQHVTIDPEVVGNKLTAEDLYQLEPLLTKEEL